MLTASLLLLVSLSAGMIFLTKKKRPDTEKRKKYESELQQINREAPGVKHTGEKGMHAADEPGMAAFHEFLLTRDPATGNVPRERMLKALAETRHQESLKQSNPVLWQAYPSNMGGRTRAIMYDPNDPQLKKVWAGGVTGGLWYTNDISNAAGNWTPVGDFWSNLAIRCITYDPLNTQILYVGTGEVETAMQTYRESSGLGMGIFRSTDGGQHWNQIPGTDQFAYITDIVVRVENGTSVMYAGVASGLYKGSQHQSQPSDGLFRSADNGATWQQVLPLISGSTVPFCVSDIALGSDNRLYVGTRPNLNNEGGAVILYSDNGSNWTVIDAYQAEILAHPTRNIPGRVVLAPAPSDPNVVYALIASGYVNASNGFNYFNCYHILRSADKGTTWVTKNLPADLTSGNNFATIAWHALDIGVDPNFPDIVYIGGLDVHRTMNGGNYWARLSDWSKMYSGGGNDYIHADQHIILYKPGSSDEILFGTDGGVFRTTNAGASVPVFTENNTGYSTLQFYTCALHPYPGIDLFYGGLQDNGSLFYLGTPLTINDMVSGGDGAYCFFDEIDPALSITSVYYNQYYIFDNGNFVNWVGNWSSGTFVSPADYDPELKILYCNPTDYLGNYSDQLLRLEDLDFNATGTFVTLNTGTNVFFSALKYSPFSPAGTSTLFMGTESGKLFRVEEAQGNSPVVSEIGAPAFPAANLSSVAIGKSEDTLMVTFSNYGVPSVWLTTNGGNNWKEIEGNLPDMPVRWAIFHPQSSMKAMIATETGVWECNALGQNPVVWNPVNNGMANVRVDMLQVRKTDNTVLAATHGRGLFTTRWDLFTGNEEKGSRQATVYPNPAEDWIQVFIPDAETGQYQVKLTTLSGKTVFTGATTAHAGTINLRLNIKQQAPGIYLLSITREKSTLYSTKIIKR
jgi:photosystem II stability/assembly factor-like uncharacterized protein